MVLFSRGGAHFDSMTTNAGKATPYSHVIYNKRLSYRRETALQGAL